MIPGLFILFACLVSNQSSQFNLLPRIPNYHYSMSLHPLLPFQQDPGAPETSLAGHMADCTIVCVDEHSSPRRWIRIQHDGSYHDPLLSMSQLTRPASSFPPAYVCPSILTALTAFPNTLIGLASRPTCLPDRLGSNQRGPSPMTLPCRTWRISLCTTRIVLPSQPIPRISTLSPPYHQSAPQTPSAWTHPAASHPVSLRRRRISTACGVPVSRSL